jgi:hypothetical protein
MVVSPLARLVFIAGLCIAGRNESDGLVAFVQVRKDCFDLDGLSVLVEELVSAGLWERVDESNYKIPSFLRWNKSRATLEELREKRSKAGRMGGRPKRDASTDESNLLNDPKREASTDESTVLEHVKAIEQNRTEYDSTELSRRSQAIALRELAFSQSVKPTKGTRAIDNMFERLLVAGHSENDIEVAILSGVGVWTDDGVAYAITRSQQDSAPTANDIRQLVDEATDFLVNLFKSPAAIARPVGNPFIEKLLEQKSEAQLRHHMTTEEIKSMLWAVAF